MSKISTVEFPYRVKILGKKEAVYFKDNNKSFQSHQDKCVQIGKSKTSLKQIKGKEKANLKIGKRAFIMQGKIISNLDFITQLNFLSREVKITDQ